MDQTPVERDPRVMHRRLSAAVVVAATVAGSGMWGGSAMAAGKPSPTLKPITLKHEQLRAEGPALGRTDPRSRRRLTVPGTPGTTQPGTEVYFEDFQNVTGGASPVITAYTGAAQARNQSYTASPNWSGTRCNGWVMSPNSATPPDPCMTVTNVPTWTTATNGVHAMASALGQLEGQTPAQAQNNYVVSEFTDSGAPPGPGVELETTPNKIPAVAGHYYDIAANFAVVDYVGGGTGCDFSDPSLTFSLMDGATQHDLATGLDPCTAPGNKAISVTQGGATGNIRVAALTSNSLRWPTAGASTMGIRLYNANGGGGGNDSAFDNPRVVDVTPQLDKSFSPTTLPAGNASKLTFTITNTSDLNAKNGWTFADSLPAGVTIADDTAATTCPSGVVTAPSGGTSVKVTGNLSQGMASCTVSVNVTSLTPGTYTNSAANVTATGLNPPGSSSVTFTPPTLTLSKALAGARLNSGDQFTMAIRSGSATGPVLNQTANSTTTGSGSTITAGTGTTGATTVTAGTRYFLTESPSGPTADVYASKITCTDANGRQTGLPSGAAFTGSMAFTPLIGSAVACTVTNTAPPAKSSMTVVKSATPSAASKAGDKIVYSYVVTNTGNTTLNHVTVADSFAAPAGPAVTVTCPRSTLAPGTSQTCTSSPYTVTTADAKNGKVVNTATASATGASASATGTSIVTVTVIAKTALTVKVAPTLPWTGFTVVPVLPTAAAMVGAGALLLIGLRRGRRMS